MQIKPRYSVNFGTAWSPWPSDDNLGSPNLVADHRTLGHAILSFCLIQPGELVYTPEFGIAPRLFDSMSSDTSRYFIVNLQNQIIQWFEGYLSILEVELDRAKLNSNEINVKIRYTPRNSSDSHVISYPYFIYSGANWRLSTEEFLNQIRLDDVQLFPELK